VPCEDRLRRDDGAYLPQHLSAQRLAFRRQSTALVVCETKALPVRLELLPQDAVPFDEVGDHGRLLATDPAGERRQEELKMDGFNHAESVSDVRQSVTPQCVSIFGYHGVNRIVHAQCWSHTRRNFIEAEAAEPELSGYILNRIALRVRGGNPCAQAEG